MVSVINNFDFAGKTKEEFSKYRKALKRPNILVCGGTGAGKSTLINRIFTDGKIHAPVGSARPQTQEIAKYEGDVLTVYDSPGYESGEAGQRRYRDVVLKLIFDNQARADERIHMVWYCISQGNDRILDIDLQTIKDIEKTNVPIAVVFTQADKGSADGFMEFRRILAEGGVRGVESFETSTDKQLNIGVEPLLKWSEQHLEDALRVSFITGARVSIATKLNAGRKIVAEHIGIAATISATPIPFGDAPMLMSNQAALVGRLASLWNLASITSTISAVIPSQIISTIGKSLAGNLIKMIPVEGTIVGAAINVSVASAITAGIGYGVNEVFSMMASDEIEGKMKDISEYMKRLPGLIEKFTQRGHKD